MARPLRERLIFELEAIRRELINEISPIESLHYAPAEGMKSYLAQIKEIGAMELESIRLLETGEVPEWKDVEAEVAGSTSNELLASLARIRGEVIAWLEAASDESLKSPIQIPEAWQDYFGDSELEREELIRWIARHEYYHLGQIVAYRWGQGHNPYRRNS